MAGGRETAHVDADLGHDDLGGQVTDARDGPQQADRLAERVEVAVHLRVDLGNRGGQRVELPQVQAQQEAVPHGDASLQGGAQRLRRCLDAALHQGEQLVRISLAVDQRVQDGTAALAHDLAQHRAELEVGVLERFLQPLHVAGLFAHQLLAGAQQRAQVLRRRFGHEARADQAVRQQVGQPQRVGNVGLAAGHILDVGGIGEDQRELAIG